MVHPTRRLRNLADRHVGLVFGPRLRNTYEHLHDFSALIMRDPLAVNLIGLECGPTFTTKTTHERAGQVGIFP